VTWLPPEFVHPSRAELATGHHLRPIRGTDIDVDYPAVMGSQARLWSIFGGRWEWPPSNLTLAHDFDDLVRHEREMVSQTSFNYCVLNEDESQLFGCVYIDPPEEDSPDGIDAEVCWWVVDEAVGTDLEICLDAFVPNWIAEVWPFATPRLGLWWLNQPQ
jgi:hypothetical protein